MFDPNNEYPDKITIVEKATVIIFMTLTAAFFLWLSYDTYCKTTAFEAGKDFEIYDKIAFLYDLVGKWPIIALFLFGAVYLPFLLFNKFKAEWIKKQIEKTY